MWAKVHCPLYWFFPADTFRILNWIPRCRQITKWLLRKLSALLRLLSIAYRIISFYCFILVCRNGKNNNRLRIIVLLRLSERSRLNRSLLTNFMSYSFSFFIRWRWARGFSHLKKKPLKCIYYFFWWTTNYDGSSNRAV